MGSVDQHLNKSEKNYKPCNKDQDSFSPVVKPMEDSNKKVLQKKKISI